MKTKKGTKKKAKPRRLLSLKERIEVIRLAETLHDPVELAARFNCGRTQILTILQEKESLLKEYENNGDPDRIRRKKSTVTLAINKLVVEWIHRCRAAQISVSDFMITQTAHEAQKFFEHLDFRANKRWLERFKKRYKFMGVNLQAIDPNLNDGEEKSMKLSDIYEDIKGSLGSAIVETMNTRLSGLESESSLAVQEIVSEESSIVDLTKNEMIYSFNEQSDGYVDDEMWWHMKNYCETESEEDKSESVKDDQQALGLIKRLEEYSLLKDNYRAVGLLLQLGQIFKGQLEA